MDVWAYLPRNESVHSDASTAEGSTRPHMVAVHAMRWFVTVETTHGVDCARLKSILCSALAAK